MKGNCALVVLVLLGILTGMSGRAWAFDEDHLELLNGTHLHFRVRGSDKANSYLLVLHGGPGFSAHMFYPWGPKVETTLNVVYLDQRGSGQSEHLKFTSLGEPTPEELKDYTIPNLMKDIEQVRSFLKIEKWYVLGHSWGGMLGIEYVSAHPEHVSGFVLMDGLVSQPQLQESILDRMQTIYANQTILPNEPHKDMANQQLKSIAEIRAMPPGQERLGRVYSLLFGMFLKSYYAQPERAMPYNTLVSAALQKYNVPLTVLSTPEPAIALLKTAHYATRDDTPLLSKIKVPVLILNGRQDGVISPQMAEKAHAEIRNSRLLILDDCGHFPFVEQPDKTATAIQNFAKSHSR